MIFCLAKLGVLVCPNSSGFTQIHHPCRPTIHCISFTFSVSSLDSLDSLLDDGFQEPQFNGVLCLLPPCHIMYVDVLCDWAPTISASEQGTLLGLLLIANPFSTARKHDTGQLIELQ